MMSCYVVMTVMVMTMMTMEVVDVRGSFEETDWGFQSYLNENFSLVCDHSTLKVHAHNHVEWELPSGHVVTQDTVKYVLTPGLRGTVTNMHLTIRHVQHGDAGVYLCHVYNNVRKETKRGQLVRGLNLGGPKYREPFDEYRDNLMVGGIAALVLFVPLFTACFVYKFRFQTKEQRANKHAARLEATKHQRYLETHGKGELSEISVNGGKGESNPVYDNSSDEIGTRL